MFPMEFDTQAGNLNLENVFKNLTVFFAVYYQPVYFSSFLLENVYLFECDLWKLMEAEI
jgi:hypothetical protein